MSYARTTDSFIELHNRSNRANVLNVALFVSLHLNSFNKPSAQGFEVYHYPDSRAGKSLASNIHNEVVKDKLYTKDRGVKSANFSVLRKTKAPATLVELGFISNREDVALLADKQTDVVKAISRGILKTLDISYAETDKKPTEEEIGGENVVNIKFKGKDIKVNGKLESGTNYVAIREVFEKLGYRVGWDNIDKVVVID